MAALCHACGAQFTYPVLKQPSKAHRSAIAWIIAGLAVVVIAAGIVLTWALTIHSSRVAERAVARQILQEADDLYTQHRYADARRRFQDLADRYPEAPSDSELRHLVNRARQRAQDMNQLAALASGASHAAPTTAPAPAPPPAVDPVPPAPVAVAPAPPVAPPIVPDQNPTPRWPRAVAVFGNQAPPGDASAPPAAPGLPPVQAMPVAGGLTDQQITASIRKGANYLMGKMDQQDFEVSDRSNLGAYHTGEDALCVYSLIMAGQTIDDPRLGERSPFIVGCMEKLKSLPIQGRFSVYARGLRIAALSALNRKEDREVIEADTQWLIAATRNGAYTYDAFSTGANPPIIPNPFNGQTPIRPGFPARPTNIPAPPGFPNNPALPPRNLPANFFDGQWDNSNSQYGLLGVWSAAETGIPVPAGYWQAVENHWITTQLSDGRWPYNWAKEPRLSMTCAGLASLFVAEDYLTDDQSSGQRSAPEPPALTRGLAWLEDGDHCLDVSHDSYAGYTYYGVERVGLASGFKYFGTHDWYRELADHLVHSQKSDGSFGDLVNSAYIVLFLSRGSHPIIMNKLRFAGSWDDHRRDLVHLARYAGDQLERPLNWQIVPVENPWQDWTDSPVLYITSNAAPKLTDAQEQGLKSFVENGGLLFTNAEGGSLAFDRWTTDLAKRLFPEYPLQPVAPTSDVFNVVIKLEKNPEARSLRLRAVSNGARLLMVQSDTDLSQQWQARTSRNSAAFDLGMNLSVYASGKSELRNRLATLYVAPVSADPLHTLNIARLRYDGNWDPEPAAWDRFGRVFQLATSWGIKVTDVDLTDLKPGSADIAVLTGTANTSFTAAQAAALADFVKSGGVVFIDACGGQSAFAQSIEDQLLPQAFPGQKPHPLSGDHPLLGADLPGMQDLSKPRLRQFAEQSPGFAPRPPSILQAGAGHVIYSPLDMTSGLLGTGTWGISGYTADYSIAFLQNTALWTARGQKDQ